MWMDRQIDKQICSALYAFILCTSSNERKCKAPTPLHVDSKATASTSQTVSAYKNSVSGSANSKILEDSSKRNNSVVSWSDDKEDHYEERQDETEVDRKIIHGDSDNAQTTQKTGNLKQNETFNYKNMEPFL
jgi:hypothetical protein